MGTDDIRCEEVVLDAAPCLDGRRVYAVGMSQGALSLLQCDEVLPHELAAP